MDPSRRNETIGFIDIGTNSIHLSVVRYYGAVPGDTVFQDKEMLRLGRGLYSDGRLGRETIRKAAIIVSRFVRTAKGMGAEEVVAMATCAAREAPDGPDLVRALSQHVDVRVIPGTEEARLIALGVFGPDGPPERSLVIDIGGGSTEVVISEGGENLFMDSLSVGAVRFSYGMGIDFSGPVSQEDYGQMLRRVDTGSYHATGMVREIGYSKAYGSSGTMIALASMCAARRGDGDGSYMTLEELRSLMRSLCRLDLAGRGEVRGLAKTRADIIIGGGAVADELMFLFGIDRIEITGKGLREGMQIDMLMSKGHTRFDVRRSSVFSLACRCGYNAGHAAAVERYSMLLFDESRALGMHSMSEDMRSLLSCAATLHDIGEGVNYNDHNVLSQMMIQNSDMVGFDVSELRYMGLMARFHHKKFPGPKDRSLKGIPPDVALDVRMCAMFLRMADILDRHRTSSVEGIVLERSKDAVVLRFTCTEDPSMEVWRMDKIKEDFRRLFGARLELSPVVVGGSGDDPAGPLRCRNRMDGSCSSFGQRMDA
ncbi:MAG: Ppx/GppA family phosphatase [Candidatus Methanomethylophilaceae archaeon]|nr:Ppx/GppA family phosphatase [Candidatus Methanomethylophilaceae archaeon]